MQSRMNRYESDDKNKYQRSRKNTKLYEDVYDEMYKDISYKNMEIIDSAKEININKLKDILDDKYDTRQYRTLRNYEQTDDVVEEDEKKDKIYDINEIINNAKNQRAFIEETKEKQKYIDFTTVKDSIKDIENDGKEIEDLINTMSMEKISEDDASSALDLLSDLKGDDNTIVTKPIIPDEELSETENQVQSSEKNLVKADKTFYTDSNMFTKNDFEDFSTLQTEISKNKKSKKLIFIIISILLFVIGYFAYVKFLIK